MINLEDQQTERAVIGAILYDENKSSEYIAQLKSEYFTVEYYRSIYTLLFELFNNGTEITLTNLFAHINKKGLSNIFSPKDIGKIVAEVSTTAGISNAIKSLEELAHRRKILAFSEKIKETATNEEDFANVLNALTNIPSMDDNSEEETTEQLCLKAIERAKNRLENNKDIQGEPIGLSTVDRVTGGLKESELIFLTAPPNVGKSLLALQVCVNFAQGNKKALYFNFEMNNKQIADRLITMAYKFDIEKIKTPVKKTTNEELQELQNNLSPSINNNLYIYTEVPKNINSIRLKCKEFKAKGQKISLIAVDYLQMMTGEGATELAQLESISKGLKNIATEFKTPIIVISSLNRQNQMRGSGRLEFDADQIYNLVREHNSDNANTRSIATLEVVKNRDGGKGKIKLIYNEKFLSFFCTPDYEIENNIKPTELPEEFKEKPKQLKMAL